MDITSIITAIISAASAIIVAVMANSYRKTTAETNLKAERRKRESMLSLRMIEATLELALIESEAMTGGKLNGNVEEAKNKAKKAKQEYEAYAKEVLVEELMSI